MIEIKATTEVQNGEKGVGISARIEGTGEEIVNEALIVIESLMSEIKGKEPLLHLVALKAIAENPFILSGEGRDDDGVMEAKVMADMMSKGILKGGLN